MAETAGTEHQDKLKLLKLGYPGLFFSLRILLGIAQQAQTAVGFGQGWESALGTWPRGSKQVETQHKRDTGPAPQNFLGEMQILQEAEPGGRAAGSRAAITPQHSSTAVLGVQPCLGLSAALPCSTDNS